MSLNSSSEFSQRTDRGGMQIGSDLEEGEFFDAESNDVAAGDTVVDVGNEVEEDQLEVEEGEISEASLLPTSASVSPSITPGFSSIALQCCNRFVFCRQKKAATS